jgi:hypothetical protein
MKDLKGNTDINHYQKSKEGKSAAVVADQRNLNAKASMTNITPEMETDQRESVRKLAQAYDVLAKMLHPTLHKVLKLFRRLASWVPNLPNIWCSP